MNEYVEVTRELFNKIVTPDIKCNNVDNLEHASKAYYIAYGVVLMKIDNYLSCTSQYYIKDINA